MTCDVHIWGRWIKGRRTVYWFRSCARCGAVERTETAPAREEGKALRFDVPHEAGVCEDFAASIRRRMMKFQRGPVAATVRGNILDWRTKPAGE